jgi:ABC1 atypical kinase-like domain
VVIKRNTILFNLGIKAIKSRTFRESDDFMDDFTASLVSLGGVYAKFLQGILLGYAVSRGKNVEPHQFDVYENNPDPMYSYETLQQIIGASSDRVQITDIKPIGVGSYSAVYPAVLDGSGAVVVKILRPNIHEEIARDLSFLRKLAYIIRIAGIKIQSLDITQFHASFRQACILETNFPAEIDFAAQMYDRYKEHPRLVVPKTYNELSNERIIVQDRVGGVSAKDLVELSVVSGVDIFELVRGKYNTDLADAMRVLSFEMFYSFLHGKSFHGDLHPGNVRILPNNRIAILDFGIKADGYGDNTVAAVVNKLQSDSLFLRGDFDLVRIIEAHFRLYMSTLYESINSLFGYYKVEMKTFFVGLVGAMNISLDNSSKSKRAEWLRTGPSSMFNELLGGTERFGFGIFVKEHATQRAVTTMYALLKSIGMHGGNDVGIMYDTLCPLIISERPDLFADRKPLMPDLALENIYVWLEKISNTNPEMAYKLRVMIKDLRTPKLLEVDLPEPQTT